MISNDVLLLISIVLGYLILSLILIIILNKLKNNLSNKLYSLYKLNFVKMSKGEEVKKVYDVQIENYYKLKESLEIDENIKNRIEKVLKTYKDEKKALKHINSIFNTKKIKAIINLGNLRTERARLCLEKHLDREKKYYIKLYIANSLVEIKNKESLPCLINSLKKAPDFYRSKVINLIIEYGDEFNTYLDQLLNDKTLEVKELIIEFSALYYSAKLKSYLVKTINEDYQIFSETCSLVEKTYCISVFNKTLYGAYSVLSRFYPEVLNNEKYLNNEDSIISDYAIKAIANSSNPEKMKSLIEFIKDKRTTKSAITSISGLIEQNNNYLILIEKTFKEEENEKIKQSLGTILANKIDYYIMKLYKISNSFAGDIIKEIILLGKTSEIIDFLNKNKNIDIENELIIIIKDALKIKPELVEDFAKFLNDRIKQKVGINYEIKKEVKKKEENSKIIKINLYLILVFSILFFPLLFVATELRDILHLGFYEIFRMYLIKFNYFLAYYFLTINIIYLMQFVFSIINYLKQSTLWSKKKKSILFKKEMLPSVSIIAPAYNEEKTIIESANSLLNLTYPDYELIIVNDGSKDKTLELLINYFNLTRVDYFFEEKLKTKKVRGIYLNRSLPKLIVVDKENGGKADTLNTGINISNKKYFCGIDADSLLEDDALLKLASLTLDSEYEMPALGGNILPINGCKVEQGYLKDIRIPDKSIAKFQTLEYIRAFMTGRLGWAYLNCLLIISGAFGLFDKEKVISVGGYLSSSGKYKKNTVGEDMELVVRLTRYMREKKLKYKIGYAYNANCWTEVPEDKKTLKKQRYRWQKGLIDIMIFHKKMIFNPRYGKIGLVAMPYYLFFEIKGPLIEIQGYVIFILACLFNAVNLNIVLTLFLTSVLLGVVISISSLIIAEKDVKHFKLKDIFVLILFAIIENLGPRQLFSIWRVFGFFKMLKSQGGWDKAERKGFSNNSDTKQTTVK